MAHSTAGLRKARRVRKLMSAGHTKTEARKIAGVKGSKKRSKRHAGLAKARKVRSLMSKGMSKTAARKKAGVKKRK